MSRAGKVLRVVSMKVGSRLQGLFFYLGTQQPLARTGRANFPASGSPIKPQYYKVFLSVSNLEHTCSSRYHRTDTKLATSNPLNPKVNPTWLFACLGVRRVSRVVYVHKTEFYYISTSSLLEALLIRCVYIAHCLPICHFRDLFFKSGWYNSTCFSPLSP